MVSEIGESVEGKGIIGIIQLVVSGDKSVVILKHFEPVTFLFFGGVYFAMFIAPLFEYKFTCVGLGGSDKSQKNQKENQSQKETQTTHVFVTCLFFFFPMCVILQSITYQ